MRKGLVSLVVIVVLAIGLFTATVVSDSEPLLGLDLRGGAEVLLEPVDDHGLSGDELDGALREARTIIQNRVDGLGVAEPDITIQGNRIVVQLPGIEDQERALQIVGQTAELRFRPVLDLIAESTIEAAAAAQDELDELEGGPGESDAPLEDGATDDVPVEENLLGPIGDDTPYEGPFDCNPNPLRTDDTLSRNEMFDGVVTPIEDDEACEIVILTGGFGDDTFHWLLGPTLLTGSSLEGASSGFQQFEYIVRPTFRSGADGIDKFNAAAFECYNQSTEVCPLGRLAIVLDGRVVSAPQVNAASFGRDDIVISGGFSQGEAEDLAVVLRYGALPLQFKDPSEGGFVRVVSATLGKDSLEAGVIAGLIGFAIVAIYMVAYYRLLGLAAIASLMVSFSLLYVIITFLSETRGLALTLAGVTGLIVSVGTSLDSNVVYFEHLKETVANGRTLRSSVDRSFPVAFRTIFWANLASLIGAAILYFLTIGSVRGFALMLGLASILDLVATYFFLRPAVRLIARNPRLVDRPGWLGIPADLVAQGQAVAAR